MTAGGLVTSLRHLDTTRVFAWLVDLFEDSHLNTGRRKRPAFSQTRLFSCQRTQGRPLRPAVQSGGVIVARGDGRARTGDPLLAKQVLFQLSYIPDRIRAWAFVDSNHRPHGYQPCALTN